MKKILLCGMKYDKNFGDTIINSCTKSVVETILKSNNVEFQIDEIDLCGRCDFNTFFEIKNNKLKVVNRLWLKFLNILNRINKKMNFTILYNYIDYIKWFFTDEYLIGKQYFIEKVRNSDIIIFVGGGMIKYKYQNCYHYIDFISKYADKFDKKVYLNAVGVEGFDKTNYKCRKLQKALNRKSIKMITTRDDIDKLKLYVNREDIEIEKVSDPAVYSNDVYKVKKNEASSIIGLCVCRDNLFIDNDINFSADEMLELWKNIINELEKRNYTWKIYTNGLEFDNEFAYKLLKYIGKEKDETNCVIPNTDKELIEIISSFKAVIATRLHSCIVAYSLNVPAIGLVWNNKLSLFGKNIKYPERFVKQEEFDSINIVEKLEKSIKELYNKSDDGFRDSDYNAIKYFLEKYL